MSVEGQVILIDSPRLPPQLPFISSLPRLSLISTGISTHKQIYLQMCGGHMSNNGTVCAYFSSWLK